MKEHPFALLAVLLLSLLVLAGCQAGKKGEEPIPITDEVVHLAPDHLDFTERVILTAGQDSEYVQGLDFFLEEVPERALVIIYGHEDNALEVYEYCVFKTEEGARAFLDLMRGDDFPMEQMGRVSLLVTKTDELLDQLTALDVRERIKGYLAGDLAELYVREYGFTIEEGGEK